MRIQPAISLALSQQPMDISTIKSNSEPTERNQRSEVKWGHHRPWDVEFNVTSFQYANIAMENPQL